MKRKKLFIAFLALSMLVSCQEQGTTSSIQSSSSEATSSQLTPVSEKKQIVDIFKKLINSTSFSIDIISSTNQQSADVFNEKYIMRNSTKIGFVELKNNANQSQVYKFDLLNDNVVLKHALVNYLDDGKEVVNSLEKMNPFFSLKGSDFKETLILKDSQGYYVEDQSLIYILADCVGYASYAEQGDFPCARVFIENNKLSFILQVTPDYVSLEDYAQGTFNNISQATDSKMEDFIKKSHFTEKISESMIAPLTKSSYALSSQINLVYDDDNDKDLVGKTSVAFSEERLKVKIDDFSNGSVSELFLINKNGNANRAFLNGKNEIGYEATSKQWTDLNLPNKVFNTNDFYKIEQDTYRYFGDSSKELFDALTYAILGDIESFDLKLSNGKVSSLLVNFVTTPNIMGNPVHYEVMMDVSSEINLDLPAPLTAINETPIVEESFSYLNGSTSFTAKIYDIKQKNIFTLMKVTSNAIIYENYTPKLGETDAYNVTTTGFAINGENKVVPIAISSNQTVSTTGEAIDKTIPELIGFDVSPLLFQKNATENYYSLRQNIYDLDQHMFGGQNLKNYNYDSFVMLFDEENKINTIKYRYSFNNGLITGNEQIEIYNYGTTSLDQAIVDQFATLSPFTAPETWENENLVWDELVTYFGEETAKLIPYLYDETLFNKWQAFSTNKFFGISYEKLGLNEDPTNYMERYKELLRSTPGFVEDIDAYGKTIFVYGTELEIFVDSSPCRGITIKKPV